MSAFEVIRGIAESEGLPAYMDQYIPEHYPGKKQSRYVTYNVADDRGSLFGGDTASECVLSMQIHLYLPVPEEYMAMVKRMRQALSEAGFTWPVITVYIEEDHRLRHIIFECEIEEE